MNIQNFWSLCFKDLGKKGSNFNQASVTYMYFKKVFATLDI